MLNFQSCLDEAEERVKIAVEANAQLEYQNSVLLEQRKTLQDSVERLKEQLCETHGKGARLLKVREKSLVLIWTCDLNVNGVTWQEISEEVRRGCFTMTVTPNTQPEYLKKVYPIFRIESHWKCNELEMNC